MDITITLKCNNNCIFCSRREYLKIISCRSLKDIYRDIKETKERSDKIVLSGGEITLLDELWDVIDFCKKKKFKKIGIITNGRKLSDLNFAERLITAGINDFGISLYSFKPKIHDRITRRINSCKQSKQGIKNMILLAGKYDFDLRVNMVLNLWNRKDIVKTLKKLFIWGIKNFIIAEQIIVNKRAKYLSLGEVRAFLKDVRRLELKDVYLCMRGFALCFLENVSSRSKAKTVINEQNPKIILESYEVDTLVKKKSKKAKYLKKFQDCFCRIQECRFCAIKNICPGIQKAYFLKRFN